MVITAVKIVVSKRVRYLLKVLFAIISFVLIFCFLQPFFVPKFIKKNAETTVLINEYFHLDKNCIDVLFLGSSQMFRTVDSTRLNDKYHINACNFGASGQTMSITPYYFDEAIKTQSPKLIAVEVGCIFIKSSELTEKEIAWNYASTPLTDEKISSLEQTLGNKIKAYEHAFLPLLIYHDRWRTLGENGKPESQYDIDYVLNPEKYNSLYPRGFVYSDTVNKVSYDFNSTDTTLKSIPNESKAAIEYLSRECREKNIKLIFFKAPAPIWTRGECESVKKYLRKYNLDYLDLNEYSDVISIDDNTDFSDEKHLNTSGATKTTDYLAGILSKYLS